MLLNWKRELNKLRLQNNQNVALILMLPREHPIEWLKNVGKTYSKWAIISIFVIGLTGLWMSKNYVPTFSVESFLASNWGKLVLVKMVLFIEIIFIGFTMALSKKTYDFGISLIKANKN